MGRDELIFDRSQWAELRANTPLDLGPDDLAELQGINERLDMAEVADVYLPLSRLLSLDAIASADRGVVADTF
ncbi:MAG: type pantothenate kinase, partial [Acidimicrobiaceae bacterium]